MARQPPFMRVATTVQGETLFQGISQVSSCEDPRGRYRALGIERSKSKQRLDQHGFEGRGANRPRPSAAADADAADADISQSRHGGASAQTTCLPQHCAIRPDVSLLCGRVAADDLGRLQAREQWGHAQWDETACQLQCRQPNT